MVRYNYSTGCDMREAEQTAASNGTARLDIVTSDIQHTIMESLEKIWNGTSQAGVDLECHIILYAFSCASAAKAESEKLLQSHPKEQQEVHGP